MRSNKIVLGALCVGLALVGCGKKDVKSAHTLRRHTAAAGQLRDVIAQSGEVVPVVKVELKCEASGKIEKLFVKEGQLVKKGDKILIIDPLRLQTRKKTVELAVREAAIRQELAQREYEQAQQLQSTGTVSQKQLDDLKSELELRSIASQRELLELEDINDQLSKTVVVAPMDGVLTALEVDEGEIVVSATAGYQQGTTIGTVADISKLEIETRIGEVDFVHLRKGQSVSITPEALPDSRTSGSISFIALTAKKSSSEELGTFDVRIAVDSVIAGIVPGINVSVEFVILQKDAAITVPYHCVTKKRGKSVVKMAITDERGVEKFQEQEVKTGATDYRTIEILNGLAVGDVVVYEAQKTEGGAAHRGPRR